VYGRKVGDRVLDFGHEGVLYRRSFVMYDKQTGSLWLHVTGEALKGPLKGTRLRFLPSEVVPWREWRRRHPDTRVLLGRKAPGMMGTFALRAAGERYGISVGEGRRVRLYRLTLLERVPVVQDELDGRPVVVAYDPRTGGAAAFAATLDDRVLHFATVLGREEDAEALMRDAETGSLWSRLRGACVAGPLAGKELRRLPATAWLVERWRGFFPGGPVVALPDG